MKKNLPPTNMIVLKPSRKKPMAGDLFVCNMHGKRWVAGRVIHVDCRMMSDTPGNEPLVYFYRLQIDDPADLRPPFKPDLLIPPLVVDTLCWEWGYFKTLGNYPLQLSECLARHVFLDGRSGAESPSDPGARFVDEFNQSCPPPKRGEYCGQSGLDLPMGVDLILSDTLGIPRVPDPTVAPSQGDEEVADDEVVVFIRDAAPGGELLDLLSIEEPLGAALEASGAGQWEGHGYDLQQRRTNIRFNGPDPVRIAEVLLPILRSSKLPRGSFVIVGGKRPRRVNL